MLGFTTVLPYCPSLHLGTRTHHIWQFFDFSRPAYVFIFELKTHTRENDLILGHPYCKQRIGKGHARPWCICLVSVGSARWSLFVAFDFSPVRRRTVSQCVTRWHTINHASCVHPAWTVVMRHMVWPGAGVLKVACVWFHCMHVWLWGRSSG